MSKARKILLALFLAGVLAVILLTWGSIGSAALTLALLLGMILIALQKTMNRDPEDYYQEE